MNLARILEVEEIRCIEPSFADLIEPRFTSLLLGLPAQEGRLIIDEHEGLLGLGVRVEGTWYLGSFLFRPPSPEVLDRFESLGGDIYQEEQEVYLAALRAYYSEEIRRHVTPALEDVSENRLDMVRTLLQEVWGPGEGQWCLECGCGSGVGAAALRTLGYRPLAYDNDPSLLSLGLRRGRLEVETTLCIDGTRATLYCPPAPLGVSFMLGEINTFTEAIWAEIARELFALVEEALITVGTEREAKTVEHWARSLHRPAEIREYPRDPLYERWVCRIFPKKE